MILLFDILIIFEGVVKLKKFVWFACYSTHVDQNSKILQEIFLIHNLKGSSKHILGNFSKILLWQIKKKISTFSGLSLNDLYQFGHSELCASW